VDPERGQAQIGSHSMNVEHSSVVIADVCALTGISWPSFDGFQPW